MKLIDVFVVCRGRDRDRERYNPNAFKEKAGYKPDVKLEYVDEQGRHMNPKEVNFLLLETFKSRFILCRYKHLCMCGFRSGQAETNMYLRYLLPHRHSDIFHTSFMGRFRGN